MWALDDNSGNFSQPPAVDSSPRAQRMPTSIPSTPVPMTTRRSYAATQEAGREMQRRAQGLDMEGSAQPGGIDTSVNKHGSDAGEHTKSSPGLNNKKASPTTHPLLRKSSASFGREKILGRYTVSEANHMCTEILEQVNFNLSRDMIDPKPPVNIDWQKLSEILASKHQLQMTPQACQELWKFLAYERVPSGGMDLSSVVYASDGELQSDSDIEELGETAEILESKRAAFKLNDKTEKIQTGDPSHGRGLFDNVSSKPRSNSSHEATPKAVDTPAEKLETYPKYDANGFPNRSKAKVDEAASHYAPLHIVAEQFLKRRKIEHPMVAASLVQQKSTMPVKQLLSMPPPAPAQPVPASCAFDYFKDLYVERSVTDANVQQQLFENAATHIKAKCQQLAIQDLERFQRECVRYRIYEKARMTPPHQQQSQHHSTVHQQHPHPQHHQQMQTMPYKPKP